MITDQTIAWGSNVDIGFTGFLSRKRDFISAGIDWFSRWDQLPGDPPVSHTFIVSGRDQTIEAFADGVAYGRLTTYLRDPDVALFMRCPDNWDPSVGSALVGAAARRLGDRYNYALIGALAVSNSLAGHGLDLITGGWFGRTVSGWADSKTRQICSQLVAGAMRTRYGSLGCLSKPDQEITPQDLYGDGVIYKRQPVELLPP